jgi:hypothetical protein
MNLFRTTGLYRIRAGLVEPDVDRYEGGVEVLVGNLATG